MLKELFLIAALTSSPAPAENYYSDISPAAAENILHDVLTENYHTHLDFNGDGTLNIADYVGVTKRYQDNTTHGNAVTVDREAVEAIVTENYSDEMIYYEFDFVNSQVCRQYELTVSEITTANIYIEFEDICDNISIEIDPFTESVKVVEQEENL